jgi:protein involved in polysaccharide export with SLBB domain
MGYIEVSRNEVAACQHTSAPSDADVTLSVPSEVVSSRLRVLPWRSCAQAALVWLVLLTSVGSAPAQAPVPDEYRLGIRDVVAIVVFGQEELSGQFTVGAGGSFAYPLLGEVKAAGLTSRELAAAIRDQLVDGFIREPQVSVTITEYQSRRVFVVGEVGLPGTVPLTGAITLLEALAKAGGVGPNAGTDVVVLRPGAGRSGTDGPVMQGQSGVDQVARLAIDDLQSGEAAENIALLDGDTISFREGNRCSCSARSASRDPCPTAVT